MKQEYMKIWLLEDFVLAFVDYGTKGSFKFWKVEKEYDNGDLLVTRGSERSLLWAADVKKGERHSEPSLSYPLGLHFGLERGYYRKWYGKYYKPEAITGGEKT